MSTNNVKLRAKTDVQKLLGKSSTIEDSKIMSVIGKDLDIVKGAFRMDNFKTVPKNTKYGKAFGLDNIPGELQLCNVVYFRSLIDKWRKGCALLFTKKEILAKLSTTMESM